MLKITTKGELTGDVSHFECESALKNTFKLPDATVAKILSGQEIVVKKVKTEAEANKYLVAFAKTGLKVYVETPTLHVDENATYEKSIDISRAKRVEAKSQAPSWGVSQPNQGSFTDTVLPTKVKKQDFDFSAFEVLNTGEMTEAEKQRLANQVKVDIYTNFTLSDPS